MSRCAVLLACSLAAGCSDGLGGDDGTTPDATPSECAAYLSFMPDAPTAGAMVRAIAHLENAPGVPTYSWAIDFGGAPIGFVSKAAGDTQIEFPAQTAGVYRVRLSVTASVPCTSPDVDLNVSAPNGKLSQVRLHITPPESADTPPYDKITPVIGGAAFSVGTLALDPGITAASYVLHDQIGVGAYLRFVPDGIETAVETFANPMTGAFSARLLPQTHDVLVIPTTDAIAPQRIANWIPGTTLAVVTGSTVAGTVHGPGGGPLAGATVRVMIDGVPSTLGTTNASGAFSVLAIPRPGAQVSVDVAPPAASGLPRLVAASSFDLTRSLDVAYSALALRDLAGSTIRRGGAPIANAKLVLVGSLANAGTVGTVPAAGAVRITAAANGSGVLPATLAPAKPLAAVVETSLNSFAVSSVDLTGGAPASIDAPPPQTLATQIKGSDQAAAAGVYVDVVPVGALALAGVTATRVTSAAAGAVSTSAAAGGHYELRFHDPVGRGAPAVVADVTATTVASSYALRPGLRVKGKLVRPSTQPIGGASVQILCSLPGCAGLERDRPLAESTSSGAGEFELVVPDPGTM